MADGARSEDDYHHEGAYRSAAMIHYLHTFSGHNGGMLQWLIENGHNNAPEAARAYFNSHYYTAPHRDEDDPADPTGRSHRCALGRSGRVSCWADNDAGQAGPGPLGRSVPPHMVAGLRDVVHLAAGTATICALDRDGGLWCWGDPPAGDAHRLRWCGARVAAPTPVARVHRPATVRELVVGDATACVRRESGAVECFDDWRHPGMATFPSQYGIVWSGQGPLRDLARVPLRAIRTSRVAGRASAAFASIRAIPASRHCEQQFQATVTTIGDIVREGAGDEVLDPHDLKRVRASRRRELSGHGVERQVAGGDDTPVRGAEFDDISLASLDASSVHAACSDSPPARHAAEEKTTTATGSVSRGNRGHRRCRSSPRRGSVASWTSSAGALAATVVGRLVIGKLGERSTRVEPLRAHPSRAGNVAVAQRVAAPHAGTVGFIVGEMEALVDRGRVAERAVICLLGHKIPCKRFWTAV